MRRSTDSSRVSHNFPARTNSAAATETRGGVAGSVTHNFCRTETCVLTETDRGPKYANVPAPVTSLSRSPVRSSVRLSAGNRYGQLKTIIAAREPTDRPSEGATDRVRWHVVQRQLLQRASQGRGRRGTREGEGPATGVVMFLGQQHRGARCLVRLLFVFVRPSVRWTI